MIQKKLLFFLLVCGSINGFSQNPKADSLKRALANHPAKDTVRVDILNHLAFEKHFTDPVASLEYSRESHELAVALKYPKGVALSYRHRGLALWTQASLSYALEAFLKGLKIADSLHYSQIQADITGNIGLVYNGLGNYQQALTFFERSLEKQRELKNPKRQVVMLNNLGDCYFNLKQFEKALDFYRESLALGTPMNFLVETNNRNIGTVFETMGKPDQALTYYFASKIVGDRYNEGKERTLIRLCIASIYLKQSKVKEAEALALEALQISKAGNYRAQIRDAYQLLSNLAYRQGNFKQSMDYFKTSVAYRDSIQNIAEASRIGSIRLDYEMQKKQLEINALKSETYLKENELRFKNLLLIGGIVIFVIILLSLANTIRHFRFQKSLNQVLQEKNSEILAQKKELITLHEEVLSQNNRLLEKRNQIEEANKRIIEINENLETIVHQRTAALEEQNKKLAEYAFLNAHKLRAPLASIMGLVNILYLRPSQEEHTTILDHLKKSADDLDSVVRDMSITLQEGMDAFPDQE